MTLSTRISEYFLYETALRKAVIQGSSVDDRADLLRRTADALDRIERYAPETTEEKRDRAYFFMLRAIKQPGIKIAGRDINIALCLGGSMVGDDGGINETGPVRTEASPDRTLPMKFDSSQYGLIAFVAKAKERMCLIDGDYRFAAMSQAYAAFHQTTPARLIGQPAETVTPRPSHFQVAKLFLDACLKGHAQEYYYEFLLAGEMRVMRCQMQPADVPHVGRCVLLTTRDVTEEVSVHQDVIRQGPDGEYLSPRDAVCTD